MNLGFLLLLVTAITVGAVEIKVLSAMGLQSVVKALAPKFEHATGHKLAITFGTMGAIVKRVQSGEAADVIIIPRQGIYRLLMDGQATAISVTVIARSGIGVAVSKGAPKPDISSPEALKRTLLAAKSISYGDPADGGTSGVHFAKVLDQLGIAKEMKPKTIFATAGELEALFANGQVEIAVNQFQSLFQVAGIDIVGPLPGDLQRTTFMSAAIMGGTKHSEASRALVDFLRTREAAAAIKANGMEPASR